MSAEMITVCECQLYMCELNMFITQHIGKKKRLLGWRRKTTTTTTPAVVGILWPGSGGGNDGGVR